MEAQGLLTPLTLELSADQYERFLAHQELFPRFGLEAEPFGGQNVLVRTVPALLRPEQGERLFQDLLDRLEADPNPERSWEEIQERIAATIACHAAVRAGDPLTEEMIRRLLDELSTCQLPWNCPHGRPILIRMRRLELETRFQRR
ncbi:MAG: hypothetical protein KatS3mg115_2155 [Candidatus Poribacteria bacterium]|nr:MAG: hypothetical protein KatS3mg115_2155 [Candidatus Poribacteria bacterium]